MSDAPQHALTRRWTPVDSGRADWDAKIATAVLNIVLGIAIGSLVSSVARSASEDVSRPLRRALGLRHL